jgi:transposase
MPVTMTGKIDRVEIITSVHRRRRWSAEEKARIVQETWAPGMSVLLVARQHGIAPNQLFTWPRLYAEGALSAVGAGEEVVPASEYRALQHQVRELQRLLGKKTLENEVLRDALDPPRCRCRTAPADYPTTAGFGFSRGVDTTALYTRVANTTIRAVMYAARAGPPEEGEGPSSIHDSFMALPHIFAD